MTPNDRVLQAAREGRSTCSCCTDDCEEHRPEERSGELHRRMLRWILDHEGERGPGREQSSGMLSSVRGSFVLARHAGSTRDNDAFVGEDGVHVEGNRMPRVAIRTIMGR